MTCTGRLAANEGHSRPDPTPGACDYHFLWLKNQGYLIWKKGLCRRDEDEMRRSCWVTRAGTRCHLECPPETGRGRLDAQRCEDRGTDPSARPHARDGRHSRQGTVPTASEAGVADAFASAPETDAELLVSRTMRKCTFSCFKRHGFQRFVTAATGNQGGTLGKAGPRGGRAAAVQRAQRQAGGGDRVAWVPVTGSGKEGARGRWLGS